MENNIDTILKMISSNPELTSQISKIASSDGENKIGEVVSLISPLLSYASNTESNNDSSKSTITENDASINETEGSTSEEQGSSPIASFTSSFGKSITKNKALLIALKPYLSKERCKMIDSVIRLSSLADVIKLI